MTEIVRRRLSNLIAAAGALCLIVFWFAALAEPRRADDLLRPYGLYVWFALLLAAVILPTAAALAGSKRWLIITALAVITLLVFVIGEGQ